MRHLHNSLDHGTPDLCGLFEPRFEEAGSFTKPLLIQPEVSVRYTATPFSGSDHELQIIGTVRIVVDG